MAFTVPVEGRASRRRSAAYAMRASSSKRIASSTSPIERSSVVRSMGIFAAVKCSFRWWASGEAFQARA